MAILLVELANHAGFCYGVQRALKLALEAPIDVGWHTLGSLVHNQEVTDYLEARGIRRVEELSDVDCGGVLIRAHGATPAVLNEIAAKGLKLIDATCPTVSRVQRMAKNFATEGYQLIVIGNHQHPEVQGIAGWGGPSTIVVNSLQEARDLPHYSRIAVVSQTTKLESEYHTILGELVAHAREIRSINTICQASRLRQEAAFALAGQVDAMVVVGDRTSSNTNSLVMGCRGINEATFAVQTAAELRREWFRGFEKIGVTAGASTPDWLIKEVLNWMSELEINAAQEEQTLPANEKTEEQVLPVADQLEEETLPAAEVTEEPAPVEKEEQTPIEKQEETFAELEARMAESMKEMERGTILKGRVIQVGIDEVMVDVGGKSEGIIPLRELSVQDVKSADEVVKVGDEFDVMVLRWDDDGTILLSKRRVDQDKALDVLEDLQAEGGTLKGKVVKAVKGGLLVDVGVVGFLPASQIGDGFIRDLDKYVGQGMTLEILEFNREKRRGSQVVLTRSRLMEKERQDRKQKFWDEIAVGQIRPGVVKRVTDYGAFVDIGGFEGLLHVSEMDHSRVTRPSELVSEGQEIEVYVLGIEPATDRVSLSRKKILPSPWQKAAEEFVPGAIVTGTVVRLAQFGAFVELAPGIDGLIHISQLADRRVGKTEEVVQVGQEVRVKVLSVDVEAKRIGLSIREAQLEAEKEVVDQYLQNQEE